MTVPTLRKRLSERQNESRASKSKRGIFFSADEYEQIISLLDELQELRKYKMESEGLM